MQVHDTDTKNLFPIHAILAASDFAKIKMGACLRVGQISKLFAELTKNGLGYNVAW